MSWSGRPSKISLFLGLTLRQNQLCLITEQVLSLGSCKEARESRRASARAGAIERKNIILDLVFVAVFKMGVFGVALATIIAQAVAFIYGIFHINKKIELIKISIPKKENYNHELMIASVKLGLPAGIQNMLFCLGTIVLQRLINGYGPDFMAG